MTRPAACVLLWACIAGPASESAARAVVLARAAVIAELRDAEPIRFLTGQVARPGAVPAKELADHAPDQVVILGPDGTLVPIDDRARALDVQLAALDRAGLYVFDASVGQVLRYGVYVERQRVTPASVQAVLARPGTLVLWDTDIFGSTLTPDNCPGVPNPDQADSGGLDSDLADGIGDVCQCGDLDGNGRIDKNDVVLLRRVLVGAAPALGAGARERCAVGGTSPGCNIVTVVILRRALVPLEPPIAQVCDAALGAPG